MRLFIATNKHSHKYISVTFLRFLNIISHTYLHNLQIYYVNFTIRVLQKIAAVSFQPFHLHNLAISFLFKKRNL